MVLTPIRKNKIILADYNYRRDIDNRLLMAELSVFDVDVLREILHSSLSFTVKQLADKVDSTEKAVIPVLDKLAPTKLITRQGSNVTVDKEMRKYYEFQIQKFDDDFEPNIEFIISSLSKVPIHALPNWYSLPRTADRITSSLIEKYLQCPKLYERYLEELVFDDKVLHGIMKDVLTAPDYKIYSDALRTKYKLSREQFEEYMLHLEYNFVCYLSYNKVDDMWQEVVTPFHEWREYLRFIRDTTPKPITDVEKIQRRRSGEFAFLQDLAAVIKAAQQAPLPVVAHPEEDFTLSPASIKAWLPAFAKEKAEYTQDYFRHVLNKLQVLELGTIKQNKLQLSDHAKVWVKKSLQDQAMALYRHSSNRMLHASKHPSVHSERNIREAEKSLKRVVNCGWIYLDDFLKGITAPIGNNEPVALKNKGKRWRYAIPAYSPEELEMIKATICERLFEVGMVSLGLHRDKLCFTLTPFGKLAI